MIILNNYFFFKQKIKDCGIPEKYGVDVDNMQQGDAIALNRRIHVSCSEGFEQSGLGRVICKSSGEWDYQITCTEKKWKSEWNLQFITIECYTLMYCLLNTYCLRILKFLC